MLNQTSAIAITLVTALAGAALAVWLGLPAAALVGATVAVSITAAMGVPVRLTAPIRNVAFATIGVTLGAGVTPTLMDDLADFPASLVALTLTLAASMLISGRIMVWRHRMSGETAALATSPGALSYVISLSEDRGADIRSVMLLQSLRLLLVTLLLPPILSLTDTAHAARIIAAHDAVPYGVGAIMLGLACVAGWCGTRLAVPAAFLLAGVLVSGVAHWQGWVAGPLPVAMNFAGFAVAGALVGTRFKGVTRAELRAMGASALLITVISVGLAGLVSVAMARWLGVPTGQVWVAYAPGGVEAMASMALSLGYDPIFVATHHIYRLLALLFLLPVVLRLIARR